MISGSIVALVTPMKLSGAIDWQRIDQLVDWHIEQGTQGIVVVGTTGESATLDVIEHCKVISRVVGRAAKRITVIAGTGANSTKEAIDLTEAAYAVNADACLLVTPYYNKPVQEGLYQHYKAIAEEVSIPQILYNVPGRTACDLLPETVERLAAIDNIIGIKEATGDIARGRQIIERCGNEFLLLSGDDASFLDLMEIGAVGNISVTANVAPKLMSKVCELAKEGDLRGARELNKPLEALHRDLFVEANPIPVKWALATMGLMDSGIRLPMTPLSEKFHSVVRDALKTAKLLRQQPQLADCD